MAGNRRISSLISPSEVVTLLQRKQATPSIFKPAQCVNRIIDLLRAACLRVLICVNERSISAVVSVFACAMVLSPKSFFFAKPHKRDRRLLILYLRARGYSHNLN